jgi:multicomponent Na+:H+ antiporter subunit E
LAAERHDESPAPRPPMAELVPATTFLFVFWVVLSGSLHPVDLLMGVALAILLGWWATTVLWVGDAPTLSPRQLLRLIPYLVELGVAIVRAAAHVAVLVLTPSLPINPVTLTHRTRLTRRVSRVALANSMTLTPGTLSVELDGEMLTVHALAPEFADPLMSGALEARVARVFEPEGRQ